MAKARVRGNRCRGTFAVLLVLAGGLQSAFSLNLLIWSGAINNNWDETTANWMEAGTPVTFQPNDNVTFNDSSSGSGSVNIVLNVAPGSVTVNNSAVNYTLGGPGIISGTTGLTKNGSGSFTLSGANTYSGATAVNAGKLVFTTDSLADGPCTLADGSEVQLSLTTANGQYACSTLTLGNTNSVTLDFDLGGFGNPALAPWNVTGTLAVNGTVTINLANFSPQVGQFSLIQYGAKSGSGNFQLGTLPAGMSATLVNNVANNSIDVRIQATSPSYTVNLQTGYNLIANQLDHGSNTLNDIMPVAPDGSVVYKYNNAGSNWLLAVYSANNGSWGPGAISLNPGEGAFFQAPTNFTLVFRGTPHVPVLPVTIPSGACYLLSRQTNDVASYNNIVGLTPTNGAKWFQWNNAAGDYNVYAFGKGAWTPSVPAAAVGESVWISPSGAGTPPLLPTNSIVSLVYQGLTNTSMGSASLTVSSNQLIVSNLGSSGQDGVSIALPPNLTDWTITMDSPDGTNAMPVGAYVQEQMVGTANGVINGALGLVRITKTAISNYLVSADFTPVGVSNYVALAYLNGNLVGLVTNQAGLSQPGIAVNGQVQTGGGIAAKPTKTWGVDGRAYRIFEFKDPDYSWISGRATLSWGSNSPPLTFDHLHIVPLGAPNLVPPTAYQVTASGIPSLTIDSENVSLVYQGLTNSSLGTASLAVSGSQLIVSNLSSSGQDGVSVAIPEDAVGIELSCPPSSGTNIPPVGAYFQSQVVGTAEGISNAILGTVTVTYAGPANYGIAADFSAVGASNYTLVAYLNGVVTGRRAHQPPSLAVANIGPNKLDWEDPRESMSVAFSASAQLAFGDGTSVMCDHIDITAENITFPTPPTAFQVLASGVPGFAIASENESLVYQGLTNTTLGSAAAVYWGFNYSGNRVFVWNIGTSGLDGLEIALNPGNYFAGSWLDLDPDDSLPVGAYLESQMVGTAGSVTNGVLGSQFCTKAGSSNYVISVDYSPLGSSTHTLQVYNGTVLVAQMTGQSGSVCAFGKLPPGTCTINPTLDDGWSSPTGITLSGGPTVTGTELLIIPEGGAPVSSVSAARLLAANIPSLTLTNETMDVNFNGLPATPVGNATLQTSGSQMAVYNLGSSGQDGVSFALPGGPAVDVLWQPFDPSNSLPAGAYVQEQIIGSAGSVVNGKLGSVTMSKLCGDCGESEGNGPWISNFLVSADFSLVGASSYTVQAFLNGVLVAQATNQPGPALAYCGFWNDSGCTPKPFGGGFDWTNGPAGPPFVTFAGMSVPCDHFFVIPENVSGTATALQLTASGVPAITFTGTRQSLYFQGLLHTSLGEASLSVESNLLTVANIGSSCQDGVEIDTGSSPDFGLDILPQWPAGVGTITMTELGSLNGQPAQPACQDTIVSDGTNYTCSFDFSPLGATTYTLLVYNGSQLVYENQNNGNSGPAFVTALPPFKFEYLPPDPPDTIPPVIYPDPPLQVLHFNTISIPVGGTVVTGDRVVVFPNQSNGFQAVSGLRLQGCGNLPQLVLGAESLSSANADATALGNTRFVPQGTNLTLVNLGSSGQDGVSLALPGGLTGLATTWENLDPSNSLPVGAYVESQMIGSAGSVSNGVLGSAICAKAGTSNYVISVDYSPLGSSTHTVQVYNGGTLVGQLTGQAGTVCATTKLPPGTCTINPFLNEEWPANTAITLSGGPTYVGTELLVLPEGGTPLGSLTAEQILTAEIPSLTITAQNVLSAIYGGLNQTPLGNATLTLGDGSLTVGNLGTSGNDGVSMALLQGNTGLAAHWLSLDPSNTLPVGAYVLQQIYGNTAAVTNGLLGWVQVTKAGTSNYAVTAGFPDATSNQCLVQVFNGSSLVASTTESSSATLCTFPNLPIDFDSGSTGPTFPYPDEGGPIAIGGITWHGAGTLPILLNGAIVQGDMVLISSLSEPIVSAISALNFLASGIPQIIITNETVSGVFQGLPHTSLGNATVTTSSNQVIIFNLGSSGQDGVAFGEPNIADGAAKGQATDFTISMLPPDGSNSLPIGAYIESQAIGTAGIITNGVLGTLTETKKGTGQYAISADYSPLGAGTYTAQAYYQGSLMAQTTNQSGAPLGTANILPQGKDLGDIITPLSDEWPGGGGALLTLAGTTTSVPIDHLIVSPDNVTLAISQTALQIVASQVPTLTVTNIAVSPVAVNFNRHGANLLLQWYGAGVLQESTDLKAWTGVTNTPNNSYAADPSVNGPSKFYRLVFRP